MQTFTRPTTKNSFNLPFPHMEWDLINSVFSHWTWLWAPRMQGYWVSDALAVVSWRTVWHVGILVEKMLAPFLLIQTVIESVINIIKEILQYKKLHFLFPFPLFYCWNIKLLIFCFILSLIQFSVFVFTSAVKNKVHRSLQMLRCDKIYNLLKITRTFHLLRTNTCRPCMRDLKGVPYHPGQRGKML